MSATLAGRFAQSSAALYRMLTVPNNWQPATEVERWPNLTAEHEIVLSSTLPDPVPHRFTAGLSVREQCGLCTGVRGARWHREAERTSERVRDHWL
jgi:hypothetical protein